MVTRFFPPNALQHGSFYGRSSPLKTPSRTARASASLPSLASLLHPRFFPKTGGKTLVLRSVRELFRNKGRSKGGGCPRGCGHGRHRVRWRVLEGVLRNCWGFPLFLLAIRLPRWYSSRTTRGFYARGTLTPYHPGMDKAKKWLDKHTPRSYKESTLCQRGH